MRPVIVAIPLWGHAIVRDSSSRDCFLGFILMARNSSLLVEMIPKELMRQYLANSANCFGSERSTPGIPSRGIFLIPVTYSLMFSCEWDEDDKSSSILAETISSGTDSTESEANLRQWWPIPSSVPVAHMVTLNSPSRVLICTCFCSHFRLEEPPDLWPDDWSNVVPLWADLRLVRFAPEFTEEPNDWNP